LWKKGYFRANVSDPEFNSSACWSEESDHTVLEFMACIAGEAMSGVLPVDLDEQDVVLPPSSALAVPVVWPHLSQTWDAPWTKEVLAALKDLTTLLQNHAMISLAPISQDEEVQEVSPSEYANLGVYPPLFPLPLSGKAPVGASSNSGPSGSVCNAATFANASVFFSCIARMVRSQVPEVVCLGSYFLSKVLLRTRLSDSAATAQELARRRSVVLANKGSGAEATLDRFVISEHPSLSASTDRRAVDESAFGISLASMQSSPYEIVLPDPNDSRMHLIMHSPQRVLEQLGALLGLVEAHLSLRSNYSTAYQYDQVTDEEMMEKMEQKNTAGGWLWNDTLLIAIEARNTGSKNNKKKDAVNSSTTVATVEYVASSDWPQGHSLISRSLALLRKTIKDSRASHQESSAMIDASASFLAMKNRRKFKDVVPVASSAASASVVFKVVTELPSTPTTEEASEKGEKATVVQKPVAATYASMVASPTKKSDTEVLPKAVFASPLPPVELPSALAKDAKKSFRLNY
jgi:hypothetical protein